MEYNPEKIESAFPPLYQWAEDNPEVMAEIIGTVGYSLKKTVEEAMKNGFTLKGKDGKPVEVNDRGRNVIASRISRHFFNGEPKKEVTAEWEAVETAIISYMAEKVGFEGSIPEPVKAGTFDPWE